MLQLTLTFWFIPGMIVQIMLTRVSNTLKSNHCSKTVDIVEPPSHLQEIVEEENVMFLESVQQAKAETVQHSCMRPNKVKNMFLVLLPGQFFLSHFLFFKIKFLFIFRFAIIFINTVTRFIIENCVATAVLPLLWK